MAVVRDVYVMKWHIPKRVILIEYNNQDITSDVIASLARDLENFLNEGEAPVHIISNNRQQGALKVGLPGMREGFAIMQDSRWGWMMMVGTDTLTNFFATLVGNAFHLKLRTLNTVEEAHISLLKLDLSLENGE